MTFYLVDGYNLLFRLGKAKGSLEKRRQALVAELNQIVSLLRLRVAIVFDGAHLSVTPSLRHHFDAIEVVYTEEEQSADDYILQEVCRMKKGVIVVSSDRQLCSRCKHAGAQVETIEDFVEMLKRRREKRTVRAAGAFQESEASIARYLLLFEKRLLEGEK